MSHESDLKLLSEAQSYCKPLVEDLERIVDKFSSESGVSREAAVAALFVFTMRACRSAIEAGGAPVCDFIEAYISTLNLLVGDMVAKARNEAP